MNRKITLLLLSMICLTVYSQKHKYLFVDDTWIKSSYAVNREVYQPEKVKENPLIIADKEWEGGVNCFGTVIYDEGKYRMWYQVYNAKEKKDPRFKYTVAYAESNDGIHWVKPELGIFDYNGKKSNIVLLSYGASDLYSPAVIKDSKASDPQKRYKMLYWDSMSEENLKKDGSRFPKGKSLPGWTAIDGEGFFAAYSPDGIHWTKYGTQPVFTCACDASAVMQENDGTFKAFFKISTKDDRHFRVLGKAESKDFEKWTEPEVILEPDWKDPHGTEFYGISPFNYFGNKLGMIWMYNNSPSDKSMNVQLAAYNDTKGWQRAADRNLIMSVGVSGMWDAGCIVPSSNPLISVNNHDKEILIYYGGGTVRHDDHRYSEWSIGLAKIRLDGFASMSSKFFKGYFETNPVYPEADKMFINADTDHGFISIEVIDPASGKVLGKSKIIEKN
ncbi:MAG: hypothetical protein Q8880_11130, partial [Bacteroidota bacterium]|nr:hypothetical protein [Bacteroidota bacterium]